jgi:hypothetical protein
MNADERQIREVHSTWIDVSLSSASSPTAAGFWLAMPTLCRRCKTA